MKNFIYRSFLGRIYLEFLLLWDEIKPRKKVKPTPGEIAQVIREHSLIADGVKVIKKNVATRVNTGEGYHKVLTEMEDLTLQATVDKNSSKYKAVEALKKNMDWSNQDVKNDTEHAKMIQKRIDDYKQLHAHIAKRAALREKRKQSDG